MGKTNKTDKTTTNMRAYKHIHSMNPALLPLTVFKGVFSILAPYVNLYMSAELMNELAGGRDMEKLLFFVMIITGSNLVIFILNNLIDKLYSDAFCLFVENESLFMTNKTLSLSYASLENPDVQQLRREILNASSTWHSTSFGGGSNGILRPVSLLGDMTQNVTELILSSVIFAQLIAVLTQNEPKFYYIIFAGAIIACIIASIILKFYIESLNANHSMKFHEIHSYGQRINSGLNSYNMGKDIRLYRLDKLILKIKRDYMHQLIKRNNDMEMFSFKTGIPESAISRILQGCAYIFVCISAADKIIKIGDILKYVGCLQRFLNGIKEIFYPIGELKYNTRFLDKYFEYIDIPSETAKSGDTHIDTSGYSIEFKNVSFKYPASENYALKNVSLKIKSDEHLAVVGQNGSGKTTFIKLLCRLYDPDEGEILLGGRNIKEYGYKEYIDIFSILFQDFKLFSFSLGENISLQSVYEKAAARRCLEQAGFGERYKTLEKGLETYLYKNFDESGIEISGGEAQKIALARVLYKNAPFIILDEPTSALDPVSEYEIYSKFNEMAENKTAVFISHRLSSCRFCENIAVFHEGELIQHGSHENLIADESGKYHELWNSQAKYYIQ